MGEAWGDTDTSVKECHSIPGLYVGRITNCQTGDTLTVPCKTVLAFFFYDETTGGGVTASLSGTTITITCTSNDEIDFMVWTVK